MTPPACPCTPRPRPRPPKAPALQQRVIGQVDAVEAVAAALARARCGLRDPDRPVAALLFVGPTGVGKTQLVRALADHYFGSQVGGGVDWGVWGGGAAGSRRVRARRGTCRYHRGGRDPPSKLC
jgi:ATP-dependent Clp protease ATP-binding subunit ClpB